MKKIILAIRGGGVKVPSIGVMKAMEEERIEISAYSGTSIGAIIATLGAIETHADEILTQVQKYVVQYSDASKLKGGQGSRIIEDTVNEYCDNMKFKNLSKELYIVANQGSLLFPKEFVFSKKTTPEVTLGEACRASCSFPIAYEHYHMKINGKNYKFWDGGMCTNPIIPSDGFTVLATFKKENENLKSRYVNAWKAPETQADFVIKPNVYMGTFGTPEDIAEAAKIGYVFAKKRMEELLRLIR